MSWISAGFGFASFSMGRPDYRGFRISACPDYRGSTVIPPESQAAVIRSRPWNRKFRIQNPIPLKSRRVLGLLHTKLSIRGQTTSRWCGAVVWRGGCKFRCRPRHLTVVQNYEVRSKIALVLLKNGTLI
ncbi:hypothetical protein AVEN_196420-1 [Araneus ventricosus]|uniref:Uncharacterized protein n=1 Tax=Araneus ventricosus TaxID=182803 RepID=A0A4Y2AU73_ARAVE|nr:hypothetical protein AVEN_196420-1 [Araneus ventricosus]